jgi:hypothetical protein
LSFEENSIRATKQFPKFFKFIIICAEYANHKAEVKSTEKIILSGDVELLQIEPQWLACSGIFLRKRQWSWMTFLDFSNHQSYANMHGAIYNTGKSQCFWSFHGIYFIRYMLQFAKVVVHSCLS